jgi:hypothetical protein
MALMYRHGDVLLIRRDDEQPETSDDEEATVTVAEGEVTGHAHRVVGRGVRLRDLSDDRTEGRLRLDVPRGAQITHEEHRVIVLEPGVYEVRHQRTMTQPGVWERVRD